MEGSGAGKPGEPVEKCLEVMVLWRSSPTHIHTQGHTFSHGWSGHTHGNHPWGAWSFPSQSREVVVVGGRWVGGGWRKTFRLLISPCKLLKGGWSTLIRYGVRFSLVLFGRSADTSNQSDSLFEPWAEMSPGSKSPYPKITWNSLPEWFESFW